MSVQWDHATDPVERIFQAWDEALGARDLDASMALYQPDATLESPLVRHLLGAEEGVVRGLVQRQALRGAAAERPARVDASDAGRLLALDCWQGSSDRSTKSSAPRFAVGPLSTLRVSQCTTYPEGNEMATGTVKWF